MTNTNPKNLEFPIWITGTIDGVIVNIPFISGQDVNNYMESLSWASKRCLAVLDLSIKVHGEEVQKVNFKPEAH